MRTQTKTIVTGFKIRANVDSWRVDIPQRSYIKSHVTFYDEDFNKFELPVTEEFMKQLIPGGGQTIEMEIKICQ